MPFKEINTDFFDVEKWLESLNISVHHEGPNLNKKGNWIAIDCPFCPEGDNLQHLGINLDYMNYNCWKCPESGGIIKLIMKLERVSFDKCREIIETYSYSRIYKKTRLYEQLDSEFDDKISIVEMNFDTKLQPLHKEWLESRKFDPDYIFKKYKLQCSGSLGDKNGNYQYRLIVPSFKGNQIVNFITRDVTNESKRPYINIPDEKAIIPCKSYLYNFQTVVDTALIVEGVTDVWRIGDGAVATLGVKYTAAQVNLLRSIPRRIVLFDAGKPEMVFAQKMAYDLSNDGNFVDVWEMFEGDPCDLSDNDVKHLRKEIFGRIY